MRHLKTLLRLPATQQRPMLNGSALEFAITTDDDVQYATVDAREIVQLDERVGWALITGQYLAQFRLPMQTLSLAVHAYTVRGAAQRWVYFLGGHDELGELREAMGCTPGESPRVPRANAGHALASIIARGPINDWKV